MSWNNFVRRGFARMNADSKQRTTAETPSTPRIIIAISTGVSAVVI
jgi:hypothetical protein